MSRADLALGAGRPGEAIAYYRTLAGFPQEKNEQLENGYLLGLAYAQAGALDSARVQMERLLSLKPEYAPAGELLKKLKVEHIKARPHHPQTCGKIEAFHKSIHRELIDKEFFVTQEQAVEKIGRFIEHYNYGRPHGSLDGFTPSDRYFGIVEALKKYIADYRAPKNKQEEATGENIGVARASKLYLVGKVLGHEIRLQELGGQLSIHLDNRPFKEINLLAPLQIEAISSTVQV